MQDVSVGGLNVRTYTHIPTRTVVDVSVRTEDTGAQLRRTGVVVWEEKNQEDIVVSHRLGIRLAPVPAPVANTWLRRLCSPQAVCC
jgi:3-methyladenine DNA glycosylase Mpg